MATGAAITLHRDAQRVRVSYRRADLERAVRGLAVDKALTLIPTLLPICATAQQIAAARAVEACRGARESPSEHAARERLLLREQALAAAWRLLVDWPRLLRKTPDLQTLKLLRQAPDDQLASGLSALVAAAPASAGDGSGDPCAIDTTIERLTKAKSTAGEVLNRALAYPSQATPALQQLAGTDLLTRAADVLDHGDGNLLSPGEAPVAVGPLAMQRHPLCAALTARADLPETARLLLAMLLDMRALADALRSGSAPAPELTAQQNLAPHTGLGCACTARGPLFHYIRLDAQERIAAWRYLAPTDWHFAPGGLVETLATGAAKDDDQLAAVIAAADPCAAWTLRGDGDEPLREAA